MLSIVEKVLLVKLYYKNSERAIVTLRAYRCMKGMRDTKGPIMSSALNKMKKFEAIGSLVSRQTSERPLTTTAVATTVKQTGQSMSVVAASAECSAREESFEADKSVARKCLESKANNFRRYPYKLQHNQELKPPGFFRRDFVNLVFYKREEQHETDFTLLWTDEAHCTLSSAVNTHNCRV
ncbi:transposable element tc3 transposase [Trichonephila inaurata madagascariensis]|uniref:Transposable element tc3 transposase n=1 Tax=Trichonephila inaurata madagascariensis TaxID=2747483 RepID=A0A8X7BPN1_9ARAC|nr:transposable element tc3 transposase [Trichonephila inaurata madagascariensis]